MRFALTIFTLVMLMAAASGAQEDPAESSTSQPELFNFLENHPRPVFAQGGPGGGGHDFPKGRGPRGMGRHMKQKMKHIEQLRVLKMLELLDLTPDQETDFLVTFNRMRTEQRLIDESRLAIIDSLAEGLKSGELSDAEIFRMADGIKETREKHHALMLSFFEDSKKILTAEQVGKMIVFHERFEFELLERLREFRQGRPGGRSDGQGAPPEDPPADGR